MAFAREKTPREMNADFASQLLQPILELVESYRLVANSYTAKPVDFQTFPKAVSRIDLYWLLLNPIPRPKV